MPTDTSSMIASANLGHRDGLAMAIGPSPKATRNARKRKGPRAIATRGPECSGGYFAGAPGIQRFTPLCPEQAPDRTAPSQNMPSVHCAMAPTESATAPVFVGFGGGAGAGD